MKTIPFTLILVFFGLSVYGQKSDSTIISARIISGDTLYYKHLTEVEVFPKNRSRYQMRRYDRLTRYVKKVYPYAQIAAEKMNEYEHILINTPDPAKQRRIMKKLEDEIYEEWGEDLKELTFMQGSILLKLIDRQTGESSFELLKEFRGRFRAFFYQSFARIFGFNLKERYDPKGEDREIEYIVRLIETNRL